MSCVDRIAETRIREAIERGEFDHLPGAGRPLQLDDDRMVPEELRAAYRLLRNSGYLPPEVEARREIREVQQLLACVRDPQQKSAAQKRLQFLLARVGRQQGRDLRVEQAYYDCVCEKISGDQ
jgi:hypothetical protein